MTTEPNACVSALGLNPVDLEALAAACADRGWRFAPDSATAAELAVVDCEQGVEAVEDLARRGVTVLALLEGQSASRVAPCLRAGALDCLVRPVDRHKAASAIARGLEYRQLGREVQAEEARLWAGLPAIRLVGESPALLAAVAAAVRAADYPLDVLILGETGTGKELLARTIHERSGRRQGPFVALDCGAIPEDLADSLLFGHRKGAFTGAVADQVGSLEQADGGTLFLDEIGNLSPLIQAKLLRALQNREIWRLGDSSARPVEFRVLAATHLDLEAEVEAGRFRNDLYHRLADLKVLLPPLRERGQDIALLAKFFVARHCARFGKATCGLSPALLERLQAFDWPGNVRQLDNAMKQVALRAEGEAGPDLLPRELLQPSAPRPRNADILDPEIPEGILPLWDLEQRVTEQVERRAIQRALGQVGQDKDQAAALLDLHPKTLARKMRSYGL